MITTNVTQTSDIFKTVKQNVSIMAAIERYAPIELRKSGKQLVGLCPFHREKTPSFNVNPEKNLFYCFGCNEGGDAITFVAKLFCIQNIEAARLIAMDFGLDVNQPLNPLEKEELQWQIQTRKLDQALETWANESSISLAHFRRCCFYALASSRDYFDHPEFLSSLQYTDHLLDILQFGSQEDKKNLLELHIQGRLGLSGRWIA